LSSTATEGFSTSTTRPSHAANIKVRELVVQHIGRQDSLLTVAKKSKLRWFGHVTRAKGTLANIIL
jgi:hypothetical protein